MIEFKRKHIMNIIFSHVWFHPTFKINYIRMKVMTTLQKTNIRRLFDKWNMLILLFSFIVMSCDKDDEIKPHGNSQAIPIYNQAYSENFDPDNIDDI